jgi:hypothetical protein
MQVEYLAKLTLSMPNRCVKALLAMVPPLPLPPLFGREDDARFTNTNSSPTVLAHTICRVLKAHASSDRPLPASPVDGKDDKYNGGDDNYDAGGNYRFKRS